jgi:hypothetical protein
MENNDLTRVSKPSNSSTELVQVPTGALIDDYVSQSELVLTPKFTVTKVGAAYIIIDENGQLQTNPTPASLEVAVNDVAFAGLTVGRTWSEKVLLKGNLTLDSKLLLPAYTELELQGKITRDAGYNNTMLELASTDGRCIDIHGGVWDGSDLAFDVIAIISTYVDGKNVNMRFHDMHFQKYDAYALNLLNVNCAFAYNLLCVGYIAGLGINFRATTDMIVSNCVFGTVGGDGVLKFDEGSGAIYLSGIYIGGGRNGVKISGSDDIHFTSTSIHDCSQHGVILQDGGGEYAREITFTGGSIYNNGAFADNTYDNVFLDGHTYHTVFNGVNMYSNVANKPRYNWNENAATCNKNMVVNCTLTDAQTANTQKQGAASIDTPNIVT